MRQLRATFVGVALLACVGFLLSLVNQLLFSYYFGTSARLDAYWLCISLVQLATFYAGPVREAIVPGISRRLIEDPMHACAYFSSAVNLIALMIFASVLLVLGFPQLLASLIVSNEQESLRKEVATILVMLAPLVLLSPATDMLSNLLSAYNRVFVQNACRIISALVIALAVFAFAERWGVGAAVFGVIAGQVLAIVVLIAVLAKSGLRYQWKSKPAVDASFMRLAAALMLSYAISQAYVVFERNTLTRFGEGVVSAYQYASMLATVPQMVLVASLTTAIWPHALTAAHKRDWVSTTEILHTSWRLLAPSLGLLTSFGVLFSQHITYILFYRGAFQDRSLELTALCFKARHVVLS
jgi:putative peptidoglycan lipid II flippase